MPVESDLRRELDALHQRVAELQVKVEEDQRYRTCFESSPVSLWEEDFSDVDLRLKELQRKGVTDLRSHLTDHPEEVRNLARRVKVVSVNQAALDLHAAPNKEALLGNLERIFTENSYEVFREEILALVSGRTSFESEAEVKTLNGDRRDIRLQLTVVSGYENLSRILLSISDLTKTKHAEEEQRLIQAHVQQGQKLESLGVLAGGIAHDFNNLLVSILGNAELALLELPPESSVRPGLVEIKTASQQAADLCRQMLAYSGKDRFVVEPLDLGETIRNMDELFDLAVSQSAVLELDLGSDLPLIEGDASRIQQIALNLIMNASEALGGRAGAIRLATNFRHYTAEELSNTYAGDGLSEGAYVCLEVSDTGCGMDEETLAAIFDPFFSTKFTGRGLGLAAVHGIVRAHRGAIQIDTQLGQGSTFRVLLPPSQE